MRETAEKSLDKRLRRSSDGILAATMAVREDEERRQRSSSPRPIEPKPPHSPVRSEPIIDKPFPKLQAVPLSKKDAEKHQASTMPKSPTRHVSINDNVNHIDDKPRPSQPATYQTNTGEPIKSFTMGFPTAIEPIQPARRRSSGLDVIAEDETTDDSTAANSALKSSQTSRNSSKVGSQSSVTAYEDVIEDAIDDSFSIPTPAPMGEHAKSMARQLGMVDKRSKRRMRECDLHVKNC